MRIVGVEQLASSTLCLYKTGWIFMNCEVSIEFVHRIKFWLQSDKEIHVSVT
jgi:hypothetical protein